LNFLNGNVSRANFSETLYSNASLETKPPCLLPILSESFFACTQICIEHLARSPTPAPAAHDAQILFLQEQQRLLEGSIHVQRSDKVGAVLPSLLAHICTHLLPFPTPKTSETLT
jgi:hypothetical protein